MTSKEPELAKDNRDLASRKRPATDIAESYAFLSKMDENNVNPAKMEDDITDSVPNEDFNCPEYSPFKQTPIATNGAFKKTTSTLPFSASGAAKKLVIKNFRKREIPTDNQFDLKWAILEESIMKIQNKQKASTSYEELYRIVENLCASNFANNIYQNLQKIVVQYIEKNLQNLLAVCANFTHEEFLQHMNKLWTEFCEQMGLVRSVFLYLDRTFVLQNSSILSLWESGLESFRMTAMDNDTIRQRLLQGLLHFIEMERHGAKVDRYLLKSLLRMLSNLHIYHQVFESEFLRSTEILYENESRAKCQELDIGSYLRHVDKRINEEEERIDYYLDYTTRKKLIFYTEKCFITDYVDTIIAKGADTLLGENKIDDLILMYDLLSRSKNGLGSLKTAFASYIKKVGKSMIMNADRDKTLVQDLMDLKEKLDNIVEECFANNEKFIQAERDAFDYFINTRPNKPAELIAKFMDTKLRAGNKECSDEELDSLMDKVIVLFRFIQGKDVFEAFYKKDLAKRLLLGRSASVDAEKAMLCKLKNECGSAFTQKLEGMFKDMEVSKELGKAFKQYIDGGNRAPHLANAEFNVSILTMGHWPNYTPMEVCIPCPLAEYQQLFADFYSSKHSGRKLQWQYSLSSAILKATFTASIVKELDVSLFQAMCLLIFNDKTEWIYEEILEHTKIEEAELKRTLQSLVCGKFRVIQKNPKGKDICQGDKFVFNDSFNSHLYRIRISQVQMKETEAEHKQTEEQVFQDRVYQIDAAIVRIMKMRKSLKHNLLVSELFNQLRFPAKPTDLKKRIESLIERDYMCRNKDDPTVYNYVA